MNVARERENPGRDEAANFIGDALDQHLQHQVAYPSPAAYPEQPSKSKPSAIALHGDGGFSGVGAGLVGDAGLVGGAGLAPAAGLAPGAGSATPAGMDPAAYARAYQMQQYQMQLWQQQQWQQQWQMRQAQQPTGQGYNWMNPATALLAAQQPYQVYAQPRPWYPQQ